MSMYALNIAIFEIIVVPLDVGIVNVFFTYSGIE